MRAFLEGLPSQLTQSCGAHGSRQVAQALLALAVLSMVLLLASTARAEQTCSSLLCVTSSHATTGGVSTISVYVRSNDAMFDVLHFQPPNGEGEEIREAEGTFSFAVEGSGTFSYGVQACIGNEFLVPDSCSEFENFTHRVDLPEGPAEVAEIRGPGEVHFQTDLLGNDYGSLTVETVFQCQAACEADGQCQAWTFVIAGYKGDQAVCFLKNPVPSAAYRNNCCSSGIALPKVAAAPAPVEPPRVEVAQAEPANLDLPEPAPGPGVDFTGEWDTATAPSSAAPGSRYRLLLKQTEAGVVVGSYNAAPFAGTLTGVVVGRKLHAVWIESQTRGRVTFTMGSDPSTISGWYSSGDRVVNPADADGSWNGRRLVAELPQPVEQVPEAKQPEEAKQPAMEPGRATEKAVLSRSANVRAGPSTKDRVLTTLPGGTEVALLGCARKWCEIDLPRHGEAYIFEDLIKRSGGRQRANVEAAPAMPARKAADPEEDAMPEAEAAEPARNAGGRGVIVADVDVYDKPGGGGQVLGFISEDSVVAVSSADCKGNWCPISGPDVPGGAGWIWADGFLEFR